MVKAKRAIGLSFLAVRLSGRRRVETGQFNQQRFELAVVFVLLQSGLFLTQFGNLLLQRIAALA